MDFFLGIWDAIDKALIRENRYEFYLSGIGNTLLISLFAVILGFLIGAFVAVVKQLCAGRRGNSCRSFVLRYKFGCVCCGDCPCRYRVYRQGSDRGRKIAGSRRRSDNVAYRASAGYKEHTSRTRKRIYRTGKGNLDSRLHCGNGYYQSGAVCRLKDI